MPERPPDSVHISDLVPPPDGKAFTEKHFALACGACVREVNLTDCVLLYQSTTTTYSCPNDGTVLAFIRQNEDGKIVMSIEAAGGMIIDTVGEEPAVDDTES